MGNRRCEVVIKTGKEKLVFRGTNLDEVLKVVDIKLRGQKRRKVQW